jgi:hypothetical protein
MIFGSYLAVLSLGAQWILSGENMPVRPLYATPEAMLVLSFTLLLGAIVLMKQGVGRTAGYYHELSVLLGMSLIVFAAFLIVGGDNLPRYSTLYEINDDSRLLIATQLTVVGMVLVSDLRFLLKYDHLPPVRMLAAVLGLYALTEEIEPVEGSNDDESTNS